MTDKQTYSLSQYQQAMLTHMGITPWQQKKSDGLKSLQSSASNAQIDTNDERVLNTKSLSTAPSQAQKQQGLDKLKQQITTTKQDANGGVVVVADKKLSQQSVIKDVLFYISKDKNVIYANQNQTLNDFKNYSLAWEFSDKLALHDNVLQTPPATTLNDAKTKRQLWALLANRHS